MLGQGLHCALGEAENVVSQGRREVCWARGGTARWVRQRMWWARGGENCAGPGAALRAG